MENQLAQSVEMVKNEAERILELFKKANETAQVESYEIRFDTEEVGSDLMWLKVTTKNFGWLHVYINPTTRNIEWF